MDAQVFAAAGFHHRALGDEKPQSNGRPNQSITLDGSAITRMKELKNICNLYQRSKETGTPTVLASVVKISGSSYRRPGAHMLFSEDGIFAGSISGGCLERDVIERFDEVVRSDTPILLEYSAQDIDDEFALGLGCNGSITILLEMVRADRGISLVDLFDAVESSRKRVAVGTIIAAAGIICASAVAGAVTAVTADADADAVAPAPADATATATANSLIGKRIAISESGELRLDDELLDHQSAEWYRQLRVACEQALACRKSCLSTITVDRSTFEMAIEVIEPSLQLVIFGGGYDAKPVAEIAHSLGMRTCLFDRRSAYANEKNFPNCAAIIISLPDEQQIRGIVDDRSACIVMNHQIDLDRSVIACLLNSPAPYIGVLGPKRRTERMLHELEQKGIEFQSSSLARLFSPVGVDIGAETPEEIALSILAEIKSVFQGRNAGFLRNKDAPIHADWEEQSVEQDQASNQKWALLVESTGRADSLISDVPVHGDLATLEPSKSRKKTTLPACSL
jgi:xanthine dehydrogenase accessory factor